MNKRGVSSSVAQVQYELTASDTPRRTNIGTPRTRLSQLKIGCHKILVQRIKQNIQTV